ncbi:hypothetical protein CYY_000221 [Polysphondylium violaceum]|uniref:Uncharacterized protein n=1 Tax=Polysphondylium violaceum TaxID=133409 RepID=A0A8J4Q277_9MYCE|nr:hypothetical protein CYY_000221 [Polysphondylium violaceum]
MIKQDTISIDTCLFLSVFRNSFIKNRIRNIRFNDSVFLFTLIELNSNNNHVYLSKFTNNDKEEYNICIKVIIKDTKEFRQYLASPHREIIDHLILRSYVDVGRPPPSLAPNQEIEDEQELNQNKFNQAPSPISYDLDLFHCGLKRLEFIYHGNVGKWSGTLPDTLLELKITSFHYSQFKSEFLDHLVSHLPPNLTRLSLPPSYCISVKCTAPESLTDLSYILPKADCLHELVLPSNRVYKDLIYMVNDRQDYEWLAANPWVTTMFLLNLKFEPNRIPDHILSIKMGPPQLTSHFALDKSMLPSNLKHLIWNAMDVKMNAHTFPPSLQSLSISKYDHPLESGVFHNALQTLSINSGCESILGIGVIPPNLTHLCLNRYNQPLQAKVLPRGLKKLVLPNFNNILKPNSLPSSLTYLELKAYTGSFESVGPLNHLTHLCINTIDQSISTLLANVYFIQIVFSRILPLATLKHNTSIREIQCIATRNIDLPVEFLPPSTRKLLTRNINITEKGSIPHGCIILDIDLEFDESLAPGSVTNIKHSY